VFAGFIVWLHFSVVTSAVPQRFYCEYFFSQVEQAKPWLLQLLQFISSGSCDVRALRRQRIMVS
jgi:hypothetical protein